MNEKHYTSRKLSQKLKAAGAPQVSEMYWIKQNENDGKFMGEFWKEWQLIERDAGIDTAGEDLDGRGGQVVTVRDVALHPNEFWDTISAYSVAELGERLPEKLDGYNALEMGKYDGKNVVRYVRSDNSLQGIRYDHESEAEVRGLMYLYLLEHRLITPEQLKEAA